MPPGVSTMNFGRAIPGEPPLQFPHQPKPGIDGRAQVPGAAHRIGLQQVVGPHPRAHEPSKERLERSSGRR